MFRSGHMLFHLLGAGARSVDHGAMCGVVRKCVVWLLHVGYTSRYFKGQSKREKERDSYIYRENKHAISKPENVQQFKLEEKKKE